MKVKKTATVYTISLPTRNDIEFFSSSSHQMLYFLTHEEAELFQKKHYPALSVNQNTETAVLETNEQGKDLWFLIKKTEELSKPKDNSANHTVSYKLHPSLERTIKDNPSTVIAVSIREKNKTSSGAYSCDCARDEGGCHKVEHFKASSSSITITYDEAYSYEKGIQYLYASGQKRWIIEQDQEITFTDASYLLRERDIEQLRSNIATLEQKLDKLLEKQEQYQCSAKQF